MKLSHVYDLKFVLCRVTKLCCCRVSHEVVSCPRPEVCVVSCHEVVLLSCQS